ncbi:Phosphatase [Giardia lamblia P15]|uniref:Serine/threonine-protein phosphatase n=1 Tax=Giardia intestinalis (strain P15) TaxID=658858 RepID=E1F524_GIAIA|nr:Phosphatase [Giardia lamblia P15]
MIAYLLVLLAVTEEKQPVVLPVDEAVEQLSSAVERFLVKRKTPDQTELGFIINHLHYQTKKNSAVGVQDIKLDQNIHQIAVVGDLHGDAESTKYIFQKVLLNKTFMDSGMVVFLGDYVDRGQHGINVLISILAAKVVYGDRVMIIRGNHESENLNRRYGFLDEVSRAYGHAFYHKTIAPFFKLLPVAYVASVTRHTTLANRILFVHGGLPRNATLDTLILKSKVDIPSSNDITDQRYTHLLENCLPEDIIQDVLWSDPSQTIQRKDVLNDYMKNPRGAGILYSHEFYRKFATENRVLAMFRGHQVAKNGFRRDFFNHYTVFSSSDYVGMKNKGAYAVLDVKCMRAAVASDADVIGLQNYREVDLVHCIHAYPIIQKP